MNDIKGMTYWEAFLFQNFRNTVELSKLEQPKKKEILELLKRIKEIYGEAE